LLKKSKYQAYPETGRKERRGVVKSDSSLYIHTGTVQRETGRAVCGEESDMRARFAMA
jgi:hypothetical protein